MEILVIHLDSQLSFSNFKLIRNYSQNSILKSYHVFCFLLVFMVPQQETKFVGME
jgi:hypothetical protein